MTGGIVGVMKRVAEQEARRMSLVELGVVTAVFPHASSGDKDNYQCSVRLKNRKQPDGSDFELRKVPVATQHVGLANIPKVGDLVAVAFVGGDIAAPIVLARLYNDEDLPPENDSGQMILTNLDSVTLTTNGGTKIDIDKNGNVTIEASGTVKVKGNDVVVNDGSKGAARQDDAVEVTIPSGSFIVAVAGAGATGTPNAAPVKVQGKITSASGSVKIGD
ncbi:MAG: phage baseplate assembly protein V [Acidobacteriia bacterium]|nr:phage baseplate assembly protein V [Terriglobia bacterium]